MQLDQCFEKQRLKVKKKKLNNLIKVPRHLWLRQARDRAYLDKVTFTSRSMRRGACIYKPRIGECTRRAEDVEVSHVVRRLAPTRRCLC